MKPIRYFFHMMHRLEKSATTKAVSQRSKLRTPLQYYIFTTTFLTEINDEKYNRAASDLEILGSGIGSKRQKRLRNNDRVRSRGKSVVDLLQQSPAWLRVFACVDDVESTLGSVGLLFLFIPSNALAGYGVSLGRHGIRAAEPLF